MLVNLQYLRAAAAMMVVVYHVAPRLAAMGWVGRWPVWLSAGVDLFFVLSGFLMWTTTAAGDVKPLTFALRRVQRIAPLYWLISGFVLLTTFIAPSLVISGGLSFSHVIGSFLFFPVVDPASGLTEPLLPQGWTLNYEMAFYGLFTLALLAPVSGRLWLTLVALIATVGMGYAHFPDRSALGFYTNPVILEFGFGVVVGAVWMRRTDRAGRASAGRTWTGLAIVAVGVALFIGLTAFAPGIDRAIKWGLPAALVVLGSVYMDGLLVSAPLKLLGDASYSIYLSHGLILSAALFGWKRLNLPIDGVGLIVFSAVAILATVSGGVLCYLSIEKPFNDAFKRLRRLNASAAEKRTPVGPASRLMIPLPSFTRDRLEEAVDGKTDIVDRSTRSFLRRRS